MAVNSTSKNASFAFLEASSSLVGTGRIARLAINLGTVTVPAATDTNLGAGSEGNNAIFAPRNTALNIAWALSTRTTNGLAETGTLGVGLFLFRDNQDGGGAGTSRVVFINLEGAAEVSRNFPASGTFVVQASGTTTIAASDLIQAGTYKVVPVMWNITNQATENDTTPPTTGQVTASTAEFYVDGDNNLAASTGVGANPALNTFGTGRVGWVRVSTEVTSLTSSVASNQRYGHQPTMSVSASPTTMNNPKVLRLDIQPPANAVTAAPVKSRNVTPSGGFGSATSSSYNVDTQFPAASTAHSLRVVVGPRGGQSSTPAGEKPDLLTSGTLVIPDTNDQAWVVFQTPTAGLTRKDAYVVERDATINVGSGITIFEDSGFTTPGVGPFDDAAYANPSRGFRRRRTGAAGVRATPNLQTFVRDAFGNALASLSFQEQVRDSDGTVENTQTVSTDGTGRIRWNYNVDLTHKAFNRFKRTSPDNPDSLGTHDIAIPQSQVFQPSGTKATSYPDPKMPATTRMFTGNQPARAKDVFITGNAFVGVNEPSDSDVDVFGVSSEIIFAGMFTANTSETANDANGVPTGVITRSKPTTAGSYIAKTASLINESTFAVADTAAINASDVWGRPFDLSAATMFGRRALFNRTTPIAVDTGTNLGSQQELDPPLAYSIHGTSSQTFDTITPPTDASTLAYYQGFSGVVTQRDTFGLTAGDTEIPGFTADSGLYGYRLQVLAYTIFRDDLAIIATAEPQSAFEGDTVSITIKAFQIFPDNTRVAVNFDGAPEVFIDQTDGAGVPLVLVQQSTATPIGSSPTGDYETSFVIPAPGPGERPSFSVTVFGTVGGSRPAPGRASFHTFISQNPAFTIIPSANHADPAKRGDHIRAGDTIRIGAVAGSLSGSTVTLTDFDPLNPTTTGTYVLFIRRIGDDDTPGDVEGVQFLESGGTWGPSAAAFLMTVSADGGNAVYDVATDAGWEYGRYAAFIASFGSDGNLYAQTVEFMIFGPYAQHKL